MLEPDTMRPCNNSNPYSHLLLLAFDTLGAQQAPKPHRLPADQAGARSTVDRDPVRSPDPDQPTTRSRRTGLHKEGAKATFCIPNVEEVVLNATVLRGHAVDSDTEER